MAEPLQTSENNRTQAELTPLLEITNHDEFTEQSQIFLEQRLAQLEATPTVPQIDASLGNFQGFIAPTTVVSPWALGKGYKLDDPSMYANLLPNMKSYYQAYAQVVDDPAKAYRNAALATAQHTQQSYFGNVHSGNGGGGARESLLDDYVDDESPAVRSIAEFKGVAMCAERAAVANNALQVLGVSPVLEMGSWESETHTSPEQHAYLFFRDGKVRIQRISKYFPSTGAASLTCSTVLPLMMASSSNSSAQPSLSILKMTGSSPSWRAATCVLSRVRRLGFRNSNPILFPSPSVLSAKGFFL